MHTEAVTEGGAGVTPAALAPAAAALARTWLRADDAGSVPPRRSAAGRAGAAEGSASRRLAALVADPAGLDLALGVVDAVARPEDVRVAARALARLGASAPSSASFLAPVDRALLGVGRRIAPLAPGLVVPQARRRLRRLVGHLVLDARDPALARHLAALAADGFAANLNLLGEAVLGEAEAARRAAGVRALVARADVEHVSVKVSALTSQIGPWDTGGSAALVADRLRPVYRAAATRNPAVLVTLDAEEYRDLDLTVEVLTCLLGEPDLLGLEAGIAVQAYLPDALGVLERVLAFARWRRERGGARVKVRLVKGANLAMERVHAEARGWVPAPYGTKAETDASFLRLLDVVLRPDVTDALRVGVGSHNLFDLALAHLLAHGRGVAEALDVEMLQGMAPAQARAVRDDVGRVILYTPVVAPEDFGVAVAYLVRRLEEAAAGENFLHALAAPPRRAARAWAAQEDAFLRSVADLSRVGALPRRRAREGPLEDVEPGVATAQGATAEGATAEGATAEVATAEVASADSATAEVATAEVATAEGATALHGGAPVLAFANAPDTDPALAANRSRALRALAAPPRGPASSVFTKVSDVDRVVARSLEVYPAWAALDAAGRAAVLRTAAAHLENRREDLWTVMAHEGGKTVVEADPEVSEAVDFARYYAEQALALEGVDGARFAPVRLTVVTPPWNFPVAIPLGSALAALAAGSAVILKPAPATPVCVEVAGGAVRTALEAHGLPADVLQVVRSDEGDAGRRLVTHPDVGAVVLTGSIETARLFASWRPDLRLLAETSGKNAIVVTPSADLDLAVADVVRSAFGHAGQKCSAASLVIAVGSVATSPRFRRQLVDAVASVRVAWAEDAGAAMGPLIEAPSGKLLRALTTLDPGESWLVEPRRLDTSGRLWSPGLKEGVAPGSFFHLTECFGPVLGVMTARTLEEAIALQNAPRFGLTGGLHSLDGGEIALWLDRVEVGNAYVNRHITGAIVRRQPFGGWKASSVGPGAKAGGPNYVAQLGDWVPDGVPRELGEVAPRVAARLGALLPLLESSDAGTVAAPEAGHEAAPDAAPNTATAVATGAAATGAAADVAWLRAAVGSDARAWAEEFGREHDPSGLAGESNVFRYRPVPRLVLRAQAGARWADVLRVLLAADLAEVPVTLSVDPALVAALPGGGSGGGGGSGAGGSAAGAVGEARRHLPPDWSVEGEAEAAASIAGLPEASRVRVIGDPGTLREAAARSGATLLAGPVLAAGRREMLSVLREQAVSRTLHRFGQVARGARRPPA